MFAILYLLFLGCLGFFLFCVDLIRWPISRFQLLAGILMRLSTTRAAPTTIFRPRNFLKRWLFPPICNRLPAFPDESVDTASVGSIRVWAGKYRMG